MAGTYYKYAERTAPTEVDWYQVGKDMSDMLTETNRVREEKKDALAKAQRESLQALADTPNGQNDSIRAAAIKYSNMATNNLKIQYDLMTRGQLDPKDWMIYRQNTLDGTDLIFNANKAYQENFKSILEDNQNKIDSGLTLDNAKEVEGIAGNWNTTDFNLSPNGTVIVSKLVEKEIDGKKVMVPSMEPGESLSASSMNQLLLNRIPFPKTEDQIKSWVNNLGEEKNVIINSAKYFKQGSVITVSDISSRTDLDADGKTKLFKFVQAENDTIDTFLGTSQNTASVLYDLKKFTGDNKPFQIVTDANAAAKDPSLILKVYNKDTGMYDYKISDVQRKEAESWVRNQMRAQYNYEEKADIGGQLQEGRPPDYDRKDKLQKENDAANMLGKFWYGNNNEVQSASDYFKGFRDNDGNLMFTDIERTPEGVKVVMANGSSTTIPLKGKTQADFIRSAGPLLAGQLDINSALKRGSYNKNAKFNESSKGGARTIALPEQYKDYLENNLDAKTISMSEEDAEEEIQKVASLGGFTAKQSTGGFDRITISRPEVKIGKTTLPAVSKEFVFGESDPAAQQKIRGSIIEFLKANASPATLKQSLSGKQEGGSVQNRIGNY